MTAITLNLKDLAQANQALANNLKQEVLSEVEGEKPINLRLVVCLIKIQDQESRIKTNKRLNIDGQIRIYLSTYILEIIKKVTGKKVITKAIEQLLLKFLQDGEPYKKNAFSQEDLKNYYSEKSLQSKNKKLVCIRFVSPAWRNHKQNDVLSMIKNKFFTLPICKNKVINNNRAIKEIIFFMLSKFEEK